MANVGPCALQKASPSPPSTTALRRCRSPPSRYTAPQPSLHLLIADHCFACLEHANLCEQSIGSALNRVDVPAFLQFAHSPFCQKFCTKENAGILGLAMSICGANLIWALVVRNCVLVTASLRQCSS